MSKATIIPAKVTRHYNRFRQMPTSSDPDKKIDVLTTRYSSGIGKRPAKGPRGGKAFQEFNRMTYYDQASGTFFRAINLPVGDSWVNALSPITGHITDCHIRQSEEEGIPPVTIYCQYGKPTRAQIMFTEEIIWEEGEPIEALAFYLGLDKKKRKSPRR